MPAPSLLVFRVPQEQPAGAGGSTAATGGRVFGRRRRGCETREARTVRCRGGARSERGGAASGNLVVDSLRVGPPAARAVAAAATAAAARSARRFAEGRRITWSRSARRRGSPLDRSVHGRIAGNGGRGDH